MTDKSATEAKTEEDQVEEIIPQTKVSIPRLRRMMIKAEVEGTSPLITHQFSEKSKSQMLDKQMGAANKGKAPKDPIADFVHSMYILNGVNRDKLLKKLHKAKVKIGDDVAKHLSDVKLGFPASGFKKAAVSACRNVDGVPMTLARGAFFVKGDFVEIKPKKVIIREDPVRLGGKVSDLRHRAGLEEWTAELEIELNPNALTPEQVLNLIDTSGFAVGVGDWRPEKNGAYGMFQVVTDPEEVKPSTVQD